MNREQSGITSDCSPDSKDIAGRSAHAWRWRRRHRCVGCASVALAAILGLTATSCVDGADPGDSDETGAPDKTGQTEQETVYGMDNRQDVFAHSDVALRHIAQQATVALMSPGSINASNPGNITFNTMSLGTRMNLCSGQRFAVDPTAAFCSGTLIDDDLVLTAGHCVDAAACADTRVVFNYYRDTATSLQQVTSEDVFSCASVVVRELGVVGGESLDFAIMRLDRRAAPRFTPAPVRQERTALAVQQRVGLIGAPSGIPFKIDSGARVRDPRPSTLDFFVATTDSFGGNSGSGVFDVDAYELAGILVAGDADYVASGSCNVVYTCPENGCRGEDSSYVGPALDELCAHAPTDRLCAPRNSFTYAASNTNSARVNTSRRFVTLAAGQTLSAGTCGVAGAAGTGDTFLRLIGPSGASVAENDDAPECGLLSKLSFTAPPLVGGLYELQAGCYAGGTCSGAVAHTVSGPQGGSYSFLGQNTAGATTNTTDWTVMVSSGQTLSLGTCGVAGAAGTGDTFVRLLEYASGNEVAVSDDGPACGLLSNLSFTPTQGGMYRIRAGCYSNTTCSGTLAYTLTHTGAVSYAASDTNSATRATANLDISLAAGQTITAGTCGVTGAAGAGDTFLRLFAPSGAEVANSDDAPDCGVLSNLSFTAPAAGVYQLRAGCYSTTACTGTVAYTLSTNDGTGSFAYSASSTGSATVNTVDQPMILQAGQTVTLGTCGITGASGTGDTFLRLFGPDSEQVAANDDACGGMLSEAAFTIPDGRAGAYLIRGGCYGSGSCSGTVVFTVE